MRNRGHNSAFVLVLVLMVLTVATALLAAAARRSGARSLRAAESVRDLQLRWAARSCRRTLLPRAAELLRGAGDQADPIVRDVEHTLTLGELDLRLILGDEQAKASANLLHHRFGVAGLTDSLRLLQADCRRPLIVRPRPVDPAGSTPGPIPDRYGSYDQLLAFEHPSQLLAAEREDGSPTGRFTCWGDGKVNLLRADVDVLRETLAGLLSETQIDTLGEYRLEHPDSSLDGLLRAMEATEEQAADLRPFATDRSACHSLWIIARTPTRQWYRLCIAETAGVGGDSQRWSFQW